MNCARSRLTFLLDEQTERADVVRDAFRLLSRSPCAEPPASSGVLSGITLHFA
ncbi:MAG: hypothetical protein ACRDIV_17965 [Ktedonobacteraceae bacterium]